MQNEISVLLIGDIMGKPGRKAVESILPRLRVEHSLDFIIANGENAAGGYGITQRVAQELFDLGIDCITSGNHVWEQKEAASLLASESRILRPLNYPSGTPGRGSGVFPLNDTKIGVINLQGRLFMRAIDCPFAVGTAEVEALSQETPIIIVDFHAEATSEKRALGWLMDGKVTAVIGTHTHVQTSDDTILPAGTGYITDCGMTGAFDSVIGVKKQKAIDNFVRQIPRRLDMAKDDVRMDAVVVKTDPSGRAISILRIEERLKD
jgi:metallophosphoesterase (TIGR00282 family)